MIQAEARHLARTLAPYRVLHHDALKALAGSERWHDGGYERALAAAVRAGSIVPMTGGFYRYSADG